MSHLLLLILAQAQVPDAESARVSRRPLAPVATAALAPRPRVDGLLTDSAWAHATPLTGFTQREPFEGEPGTFATVARVVYADDAIYVAISADDLEPARILAPLARRDSRPPGDWVGVMFDSHRDRRTAFEFAVNPAGVRRDVYWFNDFEEDASWDAVWDAAVSRDDAGWRAEFRIPFSQLRVARARDVRLGFNVYREVGRTHELQYWALPPRSERGMVSRFGDLVGLTLPQRTGRVELSPFIAARVDGTSRDDATMTGGADVRLAASGFTLSGAINPDFGQVEADPTTVNLSGQELFFPERRPLFVDGAEFFRFPLTPDTMSSETMLYTRRIGRAPQTDVDGVAATRGPSEPVTILAAAKLLGRTRGGWSFGVLAAVTDEEHGPTGGEQRLDTVIEPRAGFLATRASRDLNEGRTVAGLFGTVVRRELAGLTTMPSLAAAGALTISHRFGEDAYLGRALVAASRVAGPAHAIELLQRSAVHYFQRPDVGYASLDPTRESLAGAAAWLEVAKDRGVWVWNAQVSSRSPGFDVNDAGFLAEAGRHSWRSMLSRRWLDPGRTFQRSELSLQSFWNGEYDGRTTGRGAGLRATGVLRNYTSLVAEAWRAWSRVEPLALRGGPALGRPGNYFFRLEAHTDRNRSLAGGVSFTVRPFDDGVARETRLAPSVFWRPWSRLDVELTPAIEQIVEREQFVGVARTSARDQYVVGHLRQHSVSLETRANFAFSPTLTVQTYARPYAATGVYTDFSRLVDPAARRTDRRVTLIPATGVHRMMERVSFDMDVDGRADLVVAEPDFTLRSMRATMVVRWEYRRGSAASLVLQPEQESLTTAGGRDAIGALGALTRGRYGTVVLVKVSHWFQM